MLTLITVINFHRFGNFHLEHKGITLFLKSLCNWSFSSQLRSDTGILPFNTPWIQLQCQPDGAYIFHFHFLYFAIIVLWKLKVRKWRWSQGMVCSKGLALELNLGLTRATWWKAACQKWWILWFWCPGIPKLVPNTVILIAFTNSWGETLETSFCWQHFNMFIFLILNVNNFRYI